jgi:hypothetical protein
MADVVNVTPLQGGGESLEEVEQHNQEMITKVDGIEKSTSELPKEEVKAEEAGGLRVPEEKEEKGDDEQNKGEGDDDGKLSQEEGGNFSETDWAGYFAEFQENGSLSEKSIKSIVAKGIPENVVQDYLAGVKAQQTLQQQESEKITTEIFDMTGGRESYQAMQQWAKESLTPEEKKTFNDAVYSSNPALAKLAVQGLYSRFTQANTSHEIQLLSGNTEGVPNSFQGAYSSWAEVKRDMARPEYKTDTAFQSQVRTKLARSSRL